MYVVRGSQKNGTLSHFAQMAKIPASTRHKSLSQNKLGCPFCETGFLRQLSQTDPSYLQIPQGFFFRNGPCKWVTPGTKAEKLLACQTFQDLYHRCSISSHNHDTTESTPWKTRLQKVLSSSNKLLMAMNKPSLVEDTVSSKPCNLVSPAGTSFITSIEEQPQDAIDWHDIIQLEMECLSALQSADYPHGRDTSAAKEEVVKLLNEQKLWMLITSSKSESSHPIMLGKS